MPSSPGGSAGLGPALLNPNGSSQSGGGQTATGKGNRWGDLRLRVLSAAILAPAALFCVWIGGWLYDLMVLACFAGVVWEWGVMCRWRPVPLGFGILYTAVAALSLVGWRGVGGARAIYVLLAIVWCSDIGAYAVGRLVGGRRLAPRVSPGKTWSGAVGGLLAAILAAFAVSGVVNIQAAMIATVLGIASQVGDLGESAAKRHYNVKDSGRLIPGHGGLLDRLDGLLAASIVAGVFLVRIALAMGRDGAAL